MDRKVLKKAGAVECLKMNRRPSTRGSHGETRRTRSFRQHELSQGGLSSLELSGRFRNSHMARTKDLQVHGERDSRPGG